MNTIVIGSGALGCAVATVLKQNGDKVTLVNQTGKITAPALSDIRLVTANACDADAVAGICREARAEIVYHCAMPPYTQWLEAFPALTRGILQGAKKAGCKLVFGDNLYAYGDTEGAPITEQLADRAEGKKGQLRATMARQLLQEPGINVVIGRGADFYGPGVLNSVTGRGLFENALLGKRVNLLGNIDQPHTYTYIHDFAHALVRLGNHNEAYGQIWHVPNAPIITTREFVGLIEQAIGKPVKVQAAGSKMVTFMGMFSPMLREMKEMMYQWEKPYIVSHDKYKNTFGDSFTPHHVAIEQTVAWWKNQLQKG